MSPSRVIGMPAAFTDVPIEPNPKFADDENTQNWYQDDDRIINWEEDI
jgi:hypothetical protein